jgi:bifunctional DNA-binding transcriptional regulator/antitoxin component of YhaV-PrlF toxin-antitoxin module
MTLEAGTPRRPASGEVGKRSAVVIPVKLRKKLGIERKAAFLLENAVDLADYEWARREVRRMGLDPDRIPHGKPKT